VLSSQTDFIVVSADLITDIPLNYIMDLYRLQEPTFTTLFSELPKMETSGSGAKDAGRTPVLFPSDLVLVNNERPLC
jgi:NDP-sugar pyrophosphorylase family protein